MALPPPLEAIWREMEAVRGDVLREADGLSQAQADWRPSERDWSAGEIVHHLTLAEVATGKLTSKLLKEAAGSLQPYPADLADFDPLPAWPEGPAEAPPVVRPEAGTRSASSWPTCAAPASAPGSRSSGSRVSTRARWSGGTSPWAS
jgi:hypothetical protein